MEQEEKACMTDIFWDRVFLNIIIEIEGEKKEVYLSSKSDCYAISLEKIEERKYCAKINITNIQNGNMLKNEDYVLKIQDEENILKTIPMTFKVGYKLGDLDRIYRYDKGCYAYTVNFEVKEIENEKLSFVLKSRYMKINLKPEKHCRTPKNKSFLSKIKVAVRSVI